jgi:hypothetical protein
VQYLSRGTSLSGPVLNNVSKSQSTQSSFWS